MFEASLRQPLLSVEAIRGLRAAKADILDAVVGKVPERLVRLTAGAAARLARREAPPTDVLSERVLELVRLCLEAAPPERWKPDTALLLQRTLVRGGHGLCQ